MQDRYQVLRSISYEHATNPLTSEPALLVGVLPPKSRHNNSNSCGKAAPDEILNSVADVPANNDSEGNNATTASSSSGNRQRKNRATEHSSANTLLLSGTMVVQRLLHHFTTINWLIYRCTSTGGMLYFSTYKLAEQACKQQPKPSSCGSSTS
jgi:hypothetical protein